jgi:hypothetical protein
MKIPWTVSGSMGMIMGLTLMLTGLLLTMFTIYIILSILLGLLALGFHWNRLPQWCLTPDPSHIVYHWT